MTEPSISNFLNVSFGNVTENHGNLVDEYRGTGSIFEVFWNRRNWTIYCFHRSPRILLRPVLRDRGRLHRGGWCTGERHAPLYTDIDEGEEDEEHPDPEPDGPRSVRMPGTDPVLRGVHDGHLPVRTVRIDHMPGHRYGDLHLDRHERIHLQSGHHRAGKVLEDRTSGFA